VNDEWIICPTCRTRLNRVCPNCSRLVGLDWSLCAWCGKDFERRDVPAAAITPLPGGLDETGRIAQAVDVTAVRSPRSGSPRGIQQSPRSPGSRSSQDILPEG
jgi:hypothetical protein